MDIVEIIIKVIIPILGAIITLVVIPYVNSKTSKEQRDDAYFWVTVAVKAAEMIYKEKGQGVLKKEYVVEYLTRKGLDLSIDDLNALIEAVVKELNIKQESVVFKL